MTRALILLLQLVALSATAVDQNLDLIKLKERLAEARGSCLTTLPLARSIYQQDPADIPALQTIVSCSSPDANVAQYATHTKEIFENSRILSIVPKLLEVAQVKDLVPILKEVELKEGKELGDYLMINEIYDRMGEPEKKIDNLRAAIREAPNNPLPLMLLANEQFRMGRAEENENLLKTYLNRAEPLPGQMYFLAYVLAMAYPITVSAVIVGLIWSLGALMAYRNVVMLKGWHDFNVGLSTLVLLLPPFLGFRFWQTGKALPLGALLFFALVQIFFLARPLLRKVYRPILKALSTAIYFVLNGTKLAQILNQFSAGTRILISLVTIVVISTIAPTIEIPDIRYGVIFFCSMVLYGTIGSLMIGFLRSRESLVTSLRWIGIAATLPFLISYLVANWNSLGTPFLYGQLPTPSAIDSLMSYFMFWGVSFFLALHLGKIIAEAVIEPLAEIVRKVQMIEKGNFQEKVRILSRDEIRRLGNAINSMGDGLQRREKIEKTFRKYVDHQVAKRILDGLESEVRIEGTRVDAVVLFADVRGFTSLAEKASPEEIVQMLNQLFERMVGIIQRNQGVIDKFIGDNMMVVWGVPTPIADAELKAVTAACEMLEEIRNWNRELVAGGRSEIGVGIGLNCGPMIAGSIGSSERMEYTVIGDTVNTAQRAESIAKRQQLVITDVMYERLRGCVNVTPLEPMKIKGKEGLVTWYAVDSVREKQESRSA